jgi:co-chaperonin GroES (HSP10)
MRSLQGLVPIGVKVGDTVSYSKYAGTEVEVKGENFILVKVSPLH